MHPYIAGNARNVVAWKDGAIDTLSLVIKPRPEGTPKTALSLHK